MFFYSNITGMQLHSVSFSITLFKILCMLSVLILMLMGCSRTFDYPEAEITIRVVDEVGNIVTGANTSITFQIPKGTEQGIKDVAVKGLTDINGSFSASGATLTNVAYSVTMDGYYKSIGEYTFEKKENGRWEPWNPEVKVILRKIEKPVPMYARNTHMKVIILPESNKTIGFDLIEYDWVPPYGKGQYADFKFKLTGTYVNEKEFDSQLEVTFSNKLDGIQLIKENRKQGSMLKLPKMAPETGYQNKLVKKLIRKPGGSFKEDSEYDNNYIFRIRSEEKDGKLVRAMYGKIQGDMVFDTKNSNNASIIIKYYLNPDYTRNLEFDPKQNLFKDLKSFEQIGLD